MNGGAAVRSLRPPGALVSGDRSWIDRRGTFVPDLHLVGIGIAKEDVWLPRHELSGCGDRSACGAHRNARFFDVRRPCQPESKVRDAAWFPAARALRSNTSTSRAPG